MKHTTGRTPIKHSPRSGLTTRRVRPQNRRDDPIGCGTDKNHSHSAIACRSFQKKHIYIYIYEKDIRRVSCSSGLAGMACAAERPSLCTMNMTVGAPLVPMGQEVQPRKCSRHRERNQEEKKRTETRRKEKGGRVLVHSSPGQRIVGMYRLTFHCQIAKVPPRFHRMQTQIHVSSTSAPRCIPRTGRAFLFLLIPSFSFFFLSFFFILFYYFFF